MNIRKSAGRLSRRDALKAGVAAAALPLVHVRTAHAAGSLKLAFWDHWVPAANPVMKQLVAEWGKKNKVDVTLDLLSAGSANSKLPLTQAAEALSGTGHDVMAFSVWDVQHYHEHLIVMDDVVDGLIKQYGPMDPAAQYMAQVKGHWMALPTSVGSQYKPACGRISFFKSQGIDVESWYPAKPGATAGAKDWTYAEMLKLAPAAAKAGLHFGIGIGQTSDSVDFSGGLMRAYGAALVDAKGNITVRSEPVMEVLEYMQKLVPYLPADTGSYNDASNNRALISGKSALIFNPPSAWFVARRDAPKVAADCWTFPSPVGPKARAIPYDPFFWGVWKFSKNQAAAKELLTWLQQRPQVEKLCDASAGYDIPPLMSMHNFNIWSTEGPPVGTVYNYPIRPWHDSISNASCSPAPPRIASQLFSNATFNVMVTKLTKQNQKMKDVLDWAEHEINGYINM
jgi:hypothetical protein